LAQVSEATGGTFIGHWTAIEPSEAGAALASEDIPSPIRHQQTLLKDAIDWRFWLLLALALLTIEWIVRRRNLGY